MARSCPVQIRFVLLLSRQGKVRLAKWYSTYTQKERAKVSVGSYLRLTNLACQVHRVGTCGMVLFGRESSSLCVVADNARCFSAGTGASSQALQLP